MRWFLVVLLLAVAFAGGMLYGMALDDRACAKFDRVFDGVSDAGPPHFGGTP